MANETEFREDCCGPARPRVDTTPEQELMPVWRASFRMALVSAASLVAAGIIVTGLGG